MKLLRVNYFDIIFIVTHAFSRGPIVSFRRAQLSAQVTAKRLKGKEEEFEGDEILGGKGNSPGPRSRRWFVHRVVAANVLCLIHKRPTRRPTRLSRRQALAPRSPPEARHLNFHCSIQTKTALRQGLIGSSVGRRWKWKFMKKRHLLPVGKPRFRASSQSHRRSLNSVSDTRFIRFVSLIQRNLESRITRRLKLLELNYGTPYIWTLRIRMYNIYFIWSPAYIKYTRILLHKRIYCYRQWSLDDLSIQLLPNRRSFRTFNGMICKQLLEIRRVFLCARPEEVRSHFPRDEINV